MRHVSEPLQPSATTRPAPRKRRWLLALPLVLIVLVGAVAVLGFWVAPAVIHDQVIAQIEQRYHRHARLGEVRLNPFTLTLEARDFHLPDADGRPMIGFADLRVGVSAASLWRGLTFREIALENPRVRLVRRTDGRLNVQDLIPPPPAHPPKNPKPLALRIERLTVRRGEAAWLDRMLATPFEKRFAPVDFTLDRFSTVKDGADYRLSAVTDRGERLAWRGVFGLAPIASRGSFTLGGVQLAPLWPLAGGAAPFDLSHGGLDAAGTYDFALAREGPRLTVDVGKLSLGDLALRARGADADWVRLPMVALSQIHFDLARRLVRVGEIAATNPEVDAWMERSGLNLARYAGPARPAKASAPEPAGPAWTLEAPELRITGGKARFEDRTAPEPVRVTATPIDLTVTGLAWPITQPVQVDASVSLEGGGWASAKGVVHLDHPAADLEVGAADLGLPRVQPYIDRSTGLKLLSGRLSGHGRLTYAADGGAKFAGALRVDDLHTVDKVLDQDFVNWRALRMDGVSIDTQPLAVKIQTLTAQAPYARVVIGPNYLMNVTTVLNPKAGPPVIAPPVNAPQDLAAPAAPTPASATAQAPQAAASPAPPARSAPLRIEIPRVVVENGRMDFSDLTVQPHFSAGIFNLNGTIKGLSGRQDARATVDLTGQVDRYAPVKIDGQVNYFAVRSFTDVKMDFQNMELTTFSPYSGKFAGYRITKGKLNVTLHYNIDDQKLHATHRVVINQLQLGEKVDSAEAVKLPVKLIVALLKDKNGVIDVPIEIDGSLNDPKFQIWPVIWKVVDNLLVKIASAPFTLLGKLIGGGPELQYVDFAPGVTTLDDASRQKVASLAKALVERPAVNLEIPMPVDPPLDRPALADARFKAELAAAANEQLGKRAATPGAADAALSAPKSRRAILEALYRKAFGTKPEIPKPPPGENGAKPDADQAANAWLEDKLRARIAVSDQDLEQLGRARADAVQAVLLGDGQINPSRVFVINAPPQTGPVVRMSLSLS